MRPVDLTGQKFYALTVRKRIGSRWGHSLWLCECDCGKMCERTPPELKQNIHISCGCRTREAQSEGSIKHGGKGTRLYSIWKNMKSRCNNPSVPSYPYYGGRGIKICKEWEVDFQSFYNWAMGNGYAENLTIDRIDCDGNYSPDNCRWVTMAVQNRNKRGSKHHENV